MMNLLPATLKIVSSGCFHRHVGWPQHKRQRCLACGSWRMYDMERGVTGDWNAPERPQADRSHASSLQLRMPGISTRFKPVSAAKQEVLS
jgi:hypothetical protein